MLELKQVEVFYQHVIRVLKGISIKVEDGQIVCLLGANGAGKTTTLKAVSALLLAEDGKVTDGSIHFKGEKIDQKYAHEVAKMGLIQCLEGRRVFEHMTSEENLKAGHLDSGQRSVNDKLDEIYELFPKLGDMTNRLAGWMSGGEQQMLAIGRSLMGEPKLLMLDEPSLGLSPILVKDIFNTIEHINKKNKTSILLVEQNSAAALKIGDYAYVMENGKIVMDGPAEVVRENPDIKEFYLGLSEIGGKKNYREIKHYRRRKRWL